MKTMKTLGILTVLLIVGAFMVPAMAQFASSVVTDTPIGPAPDSGDGVPSGNPYIRPDAPGNGSAPNSGDGIPDGSGF
ncbi:hypothetical protein JW865_07095 [Candidatus Bathyarchaeota archaeon]|nr:hypothetical protein [Candidatus Bathyarchaeota archaeon]